MPYQLNGQAVATKSQRLPHGAGDEACAAAAGGGAFVAMSAAKAACSGAAMRNAATPTIPSEVRFMVAPLNAVHCSERIFILGVLLQRSRLGGRPKSTFTSLFPQVVATGTQHGTKFQGAANSSEVRIRIGQQRSSKTETSEAVGAPE